MAMQTQTREVYEEEVETLEDAESMDVDHPGVDKENEANQTNEASKAHEDGAKPRSNGTTPRVEISYKLREAPRKTALGRT